MDPQTVKLQLWDICPHNGIKAVQEREIEAGKHPFWIEINHAEEVDLAAVVEPLQLHPMLEKQLLDHERSTRILILNETMLVEFPCVVDEKAERHPYLSIAMRPDLLLTIQRGRTTERPLFLERLKHSLRTGGTTVAVVLASVLDSLVEESVDFGARVRESVERLSGRVLRQPLQVPLEEIQDQMMALQHFGLVVEDQIFSCDSLAISALTFAKEERWSTHLDHLRLELTHLLQLVSRLNEQLRTLHNHAASARDDVDSSRLKTLTIISAVFLPLNLIAGIYGMNFTRDAQHPYNMPELDWTYGYFYAVGLMVVVSSLLLLFFQRRGWLR